MSSALLLLWALTGGAIASWVMMHIWLPDPPPNVMGKFLGILVAGAIGGLVGGALMRSIASGPDPMPLLVGAIAVAMIVSVGVSILGRMGARAAR